MQHALQALSDFVKQRPWASLTTLGLLVLAAILIGSGVSLVTSQDQRAGVVVQFGDGRVQTACVNLNNADSNRDGSTSGEEVLRAAGFDLIVEVSSMGPAICKVGPDGCNFPQNNCFCECSLAPGSDCRYWSYSRLEGGAWRTSGLGAGSTRVQPGDLEGWIWGYGTVNQGAQPPLYSFDDVCMLEVASPTSTASSTATASLTASAAHTPLPTYTALPTNTPLPTYTALPSFTPPASPTNQPSPSQTAQIAATQTNTLVPASHTPSRAEIQQVSQFYIYLPHFIHMVKEIVQPAEIPSPIPEQLDQAELDQPTQIMPTSSPTPSLTATASASPTSSSTPSPTSALEAQQVPPRPSNTPGLQALIQPTLHTSSALLAADQPIPAAPKPSFGPYLAFFAIIGGLISFWLISRHLQGSS